jgi:hypothetical protein
MGVDAVLVAWTQRFIRAGLDRAAPYTPSDPPRAGRFLRWEQRIARPEDWDSYGTNVVYSCGGVVDRTLLLPYGVADQYTAFSSASVDDVLSCHE